MTDNPLYNMILGLIIRHGLTASGAWLVASGWVATSDEASYERIGIGIITGAAGLGWSLWQKYGHAALIKKWNAVPAPAQTAAVIKSGVETKK